MHVKKRSPEPRTRPRRACRRRFAHFTVGVACLLLLATGAGCGTVNSYASRCPGPYSGVRSDVEILESLGSFWKDGFDWVTLVLDVPLSAVADTLTAPIGYSVYAGAPTPPGLGCGWSRYAAEDWTGPR